MSKDPRQDLLDFLTVNAPEHTFYDTLDVVKSRRIDGIELIRSVGQPMDDLGTRMPDMYVSCRLLVILPSHTFGRFLKVFFETQVALVKFLEDFEESERYYAIIKSRVYSDALDLYVEMTTCEAIPNYSTYSYFDDGDNYFEEDSLAELENAIINFYSNIDNLHTQSELRKMFEYNYNAQYYGLFNKKIGCWIQVDWEISDKLDETEIALIVPIRNTYRYTRAIHKIKDLHKFISLELVPTRIK